MDIISYNEGATANGRIDTLDSTTVKLTGNQTIDGTKTFSSNIVGSITGNAATATKLSTARTIGGVGFDGTANINLPGVNAAGNQNTTGNSATATKLATARTIGGVAFDGTANITLPGVNATGNQSTTGNSATATTITGLTATVDELNYVDGVTSNIQTQLAGKLGTTDTAAAATKLQTARTVNGVAFDGSVNITIEDSTKLTATNPAITGSITEQVYNLTGTVISPANGTIQYKTVSANTTFTETLTAGQSVILRLINADTRTITFPTITWVGAVAPILTANCAIVLWKEQSTLYGAYVGTLV